MTPVLSVAGYTLDFSTRAGMRRVLEDVSLAIAPGEVLGLVGESGSGKTSLARAIMRYLPGNAHEGAGQILLGEIDLRSADPRSLSAIRGRRISMVFQDPATSLNPTLTLGRQLTEVLTRHRGLGRAEARRLGIDLLRRVELRDPEALMRRYPHEASGGEKQRVVIATAFACRPDLILFDEPTTALDVITGARILDLFRRLREETGVAALYISHDLALVSRIADRVAVIRRGRVVEEQPAASIFRAPRHDYTRQLVAAVPRPERRLVADHPAAGALLSVRGIAVRYGRPRLFRRGEIVVIAGCQPGGAAGRDPGPGGQVRLRQVVAGPRLYRPGILHRRTSPSVAAPLPGRRAWTAPIAARCRSSSSIRTPRSTRASASPTSWRGRSACSAATSGKFRPFLRRCSSRRITPGVTPISSRAARSSGWRSLAPSPPGPLSSSATRSPPPSTSRCRPR